MLAADSSLIRKCSCLRPVTVLPLRSVTVTGSRTSRDSAENEAASLITFAGLGRRNWPERGAAQTAATTQVSQKFRPVLVGYPGFERIEVSFKFQRVADTVPGASH